MTKKKTKKLEETETPETPEDVSEETDADETDDRIDDPGDDLEPVTDPGGLEDDEDLGAKAGVDAAPSTEPAPPSGSEVLSDEEDIPTRSSKKKRHEGTMRYLVTAQGEVKRDGAYYGPGDALRLTAEEADALGDAVEMLGSDRDLSLEE